MNTETQAANEASTAAPPAVKKAKRKPAPKAAAKKAPMKKTVAKKPAPKKAPVKKPAAKKAAATPRILAARSAITRPFFNPAKNLDYKKGDLVDVQLNTRDYSEVWVVKKAKVVKVNHTSVGGFVVVDLGKKGEIEIHKARPVNVRRAKR